jgi:hypothetical protein
MDYLGKMLETTWPGFDEGRGQEPISDPMEMHLP